MVNIATLTFKRNQTKRPPNLISVGSRMKRRKQLRASFKMWNIALKEHGVRQL